MHSTVLAWTLLALFDLAINATAGASAATVGAHLNHKPATPKVVRLGALAGLTKAAITTFQQIVMMGKISFVFRVVLLLILSPFGICLVVTAEMCNLTLGEGKYFSPGQPV